MSSLRYLGRTKKLEMGHARSIVSNHCSRDNMLKTDALIAFAPKCAAVGSAYRDFKQMIKQNKVLRSPLIPEHSENWASFEALRLFKKMISERNESYPRNEYASAFVLKSCVRVENFSLGRQCHGYLLKSGLVFHPHVKIALLNLYYMLLDVVGAWEVLVSVPQSDTCTDGDNSLLDEAFNIIRKMCAEDLVWNKASYVGIFGLCARVKDLKLGRQVHNKLLKSDVEFDVSVGNALMKMYVKCGCGGHAAFYLDTFEARNVVSYTTVMADFSEKGFFDGPFIFLRKMQRDGISPNESVFRILLDTSAEIFSRTDGNILHALAEKTGFKGDKKVEDALISMYLRTGDIKAAEKVFLGMTYRDIVTLNAMICGYCVHCFGNEALALFQEMLNLGEDVNDVTFVAVLDACAQLGLVEEGFHYLYELMKEKGVEPDKIHYRGVMNILIRVGRLDEAYSFMVSTPIQYDGHSWSALLNARDAHRYNISARIADLFEIPDGVATRLSEHAGVAHIGELLENKYDIKLDVEPGVSWFEVKKQIYMFDSVVNGDPTFVAIHKKVKPLFASIKAGDVVHNNVEDEMKEDCEGYQVQ